MEKLKLYKPVKSDKKFKKYKVLTKNGIIHFGDTRYEQFKDKGGVYKKLDHGDKKRQENYCKRSAGIKDKNGKLTKNNKESPNYWSRTYLWDC